MIHRGTWHQLRVLRHDMAQGTLVQYNNLPSVGRAAGACSAVYLVCVQWT